jgi:uncharacterized protein YvpB
MSSGTNPQPLGRSGFSSIQQPCRKLVRSLPALIVLNALFLGSFLALVLFRSADPGQASAIVPPTPSRAFQQPVQPATSDPTQSPTVYPSVTSSPAATSQPPETPSPSPTLPPSASIEGVSGHRQSMPLSCEARSAVDWAAYFGWKIEEGKFFAGIPAADNPEEGFVGDVQGSWGQIPPDDYGVHAEPIAQRLREYGLNAKSLRHMTLEELKAEIAANRPVIVWVVGHVNRGTPVPYTSSTGEEITVAKFEHTVIVVAYGEHKITVVDGARMYSIYEGEFMKSWDVLENQAVIWID